MKRSSWTLLFAIVEMLLAVAAMIFAVKAHGEYWIGWMFFLKSVGAFGMAFVIASLVSIMTVSFRERNLKWKTDSDSAWIWIALAEILLPASLTTPVLYWHETSQVTVGFWLVLVPCLSAGIPIVLMLVQGLSQVHILRREKREETAALEKKRAAAERRAQEAKERAEREYAALQKKKSEFEHFRLGKEGCSRLIALYDSRRRELNLRYAGQAIMRYISHRDEDVQLVDAYLDCGEKDAEYVHAAKIGNETPQPSYVEINTVFVNSPLTIKFFLEEDITKIDVGDGVNSFETWQDALTFLDAKI